MNINFWGVRGSIPAPLTSQQIQEKIGHLLKVLTPRDVESDASKEAFLLHLPDWVKGTVGGNTSCVEVTGSDGTKIVFDAGSGMRVLGKKGTPPENLHYHVLFSHFHWDHIQGLPFFDFAYNPNATFDVYSPYENMEQFLRAQMAQPYYPVPFEAFSKKFSFHVVKPNEDFTVGGFTVRCIEMSHPGKSYSYLLQEGERRFVYATDVELGQKDFEENADMAAVFRNANVLVIDSQYTFDESVKKAHWGHSAFCKAVDFAARWHVKDMYLFHHEPVYDDHKLYSILESAQWYAKYIADGAVSVHLAVEGLHIDL